MSAPLGDGRARREEAMSEFAELASDTSIEATAAALGGNGIDEPGGRLG